MTPDNPLEHLQAEAVELVRALCVVAGTEDAVIEVLNEYGKTVSTSHAINVCIAALIETFGSCMHYPVDLTTGTPTPITIP